MFSCVSMRTASTFWKLILYFSRSFWMKTKAWKYEPRIPKVSKIPKKWDGGSIFKPQGFGKVTLVTISATVVWQHSPGGVTQIMQRGSNISTPLHVCSGSSSGDLNRGGTALLETHLCRRWGWVIKGRALSSAQAHTQIWFQISRCFIYFFFTLQI